MQKPTATSTGRITCFIAALIKGLLRPIPWDWKEDLTVYFSPDGFTEEDSPPGEPNPDPLPSAVEMSTITLAKLEPDGTMVSLSCKRIDPTAGSGYFTITEDDDHNETLKTYYTTTVDTTDRLYKVTGTMKTYNSERILCVDSGPGTVFNPAVDQTGYAQTTAAGTIAYIKTLPDETELDTGSLIGKVVTAIFAASPAFFYIQEPAGSGYDYSGIKVVSSATVEIGDLVDIEGTVYGAPTYPECYISPSSVQVVGAAALPRPVGMNNRWTAAGSFGLQSALYRDVIADPMEVGAGLNPVGIIVRAWGGYFTGTVGGSAAYYVDDGSGLLGSVSAYAHTGLRLWYAPNTSAPEWESGVSYVAATGILGAEWSDSDPQVPVPVLRLDSTVPVIQVTDDGDETAIRTQLHFNWNVTDDESGIANCQYAVGITSTDPGSGYTVEWTSASSVGEATELVTLSPDATYYVYIKAINGAGLLATAASDGITVNTSAHVVDMITDNRDANGEIKQYEMFEAHFSINPNWIGEAFTDYNPFSPKLAAYDTNSSRTWECLDGIYVDAVITKPDETEIRWPCFYDYDHDADDVPEWRFRFAPTAQGAWSYHVEVRFGSGATEVVTGPTRSFTCTENTDPVTGRGFLTVDDNDYRFFSFSNGEVFYPMGVKCDEISDINSLADNGGNFSRLFNPNPMFEQMYSLGYPAGGDRVNDFRNNDHTPVWADADWWDEFIETARTRGVYLLYLCNDWTRWKSHDTTVAAGGCAANSTTIPVENTSSFEDSPKMVRINGLNTVEYESKDSTHLYGCSAHPAYSGGEQVNQTENPYIAEGVAANIGETFLDDPTDMREVYKRKLRWLMARWGYSTSIIGFDLINECWRDRSSTRGFHNDMAAFINGNDSAVPSEWPVHTTNDFEQQPHLLTGDQPSSRYDEVSISWPDSQIGMTNHHDYALKRNDGSGLTWTDLRWTASDGTSKTGWDDMGCTVYWPWQDTTVWADRMARVHQKCGYQKPLSWSEYGLIYVNSSNKWLDWTLAYEDDTAGQHAKDWYWGLALTGISGSHWHPQWWRGDYGGGTKWFILKPLASFLSGVNLRGLTQESYYPVSDSLHPTKMLISSDSDVGIFGFRGSNKAYLYVKNLTNTWYYSAGFTDHISAPVAKGATITIKGLAAGTYTIEKWSTTDTNPATQIKSTETKAIGSGEDLTFTTSLGATTDYDWGYKIY